MINDPDGYYRAVLAHVRAMIRMHWPKDIHDPSQSFLDRLAVQPFTRFVALIPPLLRDVFPVSQAQCHLLSVASIFGWMFYAPLDAVLDADAPVETIILGHCAYSCMFALYHELDIPRDHWDIITCLTGYAGSGYWREYLSRAAHGEMPSAFQLALIDETFVQHRAAALFIAPRIQCRLSGYSLDLPRSRAILGALEAFNVVRQYSDDLTDWHSDLQKGFPNLVSSALLRYCLDQPAINAAEVTSANALAGLCLLYPESWSRIQRRHYAILDHAIEEIRQYDTCASITALLHEQRRDVDELWMHIAKFQRGVRQLLLLEER